MIGREKNGVPLRAQRLDIIHAVLLDARDPVFAAEMDVTVHPHPGRTNP
jgi:hypothetical protein